MKCDYAISVHCNSSDSPSPDYIATFIQDTGGEAEKLARAVQKQVAAATEWPNGGVRTQNLHMTRETNMPAILVECGFISNPSQEEQLRKDITQTLLAAAIAKGVCEYLGIGDVKEEEAMTTDKALEVLKQHGVIGETDYWKKATACVKYLDTLIINAAQKLQQLEVE